MAPACRCRFSCPCASSSASFQSLGPGGCAQLPRQSKVREFGHEAAGVGVGALGGGAAVMELVACVLGNAWNVLGNVWNGNALYMCVERGGKIVGIGDIHSQSVTTSRQPTSHSHAQAALTTEQLPTTPLTPHNAPSTPLQPPSSPLIPHPHLQQYVGGLEVAVCDVAGVQVAQRRRHVSRGVQQSAQRYHLGVRVCVGGGCVCVAHVCVCGGGGGEEEAGCKYQPKLNQTSGAQGGLRWGAHVGSTHVVAPSRCPFCTRP